MTLTKEELEVVSDLIQDWGFNTTLKAEELIPLAKRLGLTEWIQDQEEVARFYSNKKVGA